jgi:hypothetical protein
MVKKSHFLLHCFKLFFILQTGWVSDDNDILFDNVLDDLASLPVALAEGLADTRDLCINRWASHSV